MAGRIEMGPVPLGESDWVRARKDGETLPKPPTRDGVTVSDKSFDEQGGKPADKPNPQ